MMAMEDRGWKIEECGRTQQLTKNQ
jgi:hypothetical protein